MRKVGEEFEVGGKWWVVAEVIHAHDDEFSIRYADGCVVTLGGENTYRVGQRLWLGTKDDGMPMFIDSDPEAS